MGYTEFLVVGAGPAGIQAAIFLQERGANYVVLEKTSRVSAHFRNYPRHRQLISINKKYTGSSNNDFNLRHDWNSLLTTNPDQPLFPSYSDDLYPSADILCKYLEDVVSSHNLNIIANCGVDKISRDADGLFQLSTAKGSYTCSYLLIATGGTPWYPSIKGLQHPLVDTYESVSLNKDDFTNLKVLILGKGNSAFECAEHLSDKAAIIHLVSPRQINFAWNTRYVGDLRAVRNNILDLYQLKSQYAILNANITNIEYCEKQQRPFIVDFDFTFTPDDPNNRIAYDRIIACTGFGYLHASLFDPKSINISADSRPELKGKFPLITPEWQFVGTSRMYALGAMMQSLNYRKNAGGFIHGFRYSIKTLIDLIFYTEFGQPLRSTRLVSIEAVLEEVFARINNASSLYQMYGELCDVIVLGKNQNEYEYFYDLPVAFARTNFQHCRIVLVSFALSSRQTSDDAFSFVPIATPATPELSVFIHPLLQMVDCCYSESRELHLLENIDIEWTDPVLHVAPVLEFLHQHFLKSADRVCTATA